MCNAPAVQSTVIAESGIPLIVNVPDPRSFAIHKAWLSNQPNRDPVKKPRDLTQSLIVFEMLHLYMPLFPLEQAHLRYLPKEVINHFVGLFEKESEIELPNLRI